MPQGTSAAMQAFVTANSGYISAIGDDISDMATKAAALQKTLDDLNNSPPQLTPEDQALLDTAIAQVAALKASADAADGKTPPAPPTP